MTVIVLAFLTFITILLAAVLVMQPVFTQYVDAYSVRVRAKPRDDASAAERPKDSQLLLMARTLGELVLAAVPNVADKRTVTLLIQANYRTPQHLAIYTGIRSLLVASIVALSLAASINNSMGLLLMLPAGLVCWLLPNFVLAQRAKKRQEKILSELPTVIDLLIVCAQAGLGLLMAVDKVSLEVADSCPVLSQEMKQLINDVKIFAKGTAHAFREMGERCGVDELINLAAALIAAEAKGADISYPLRQQADALRDRLKRKKEEEAGKVPVKMVPVIMTFIMPLILAPMLGPAVVTIAIAFDPILRSLK